MCFVFPIHFSIVIFLLHYFDDKTKTTRSVLNEFLMCKYHLSTQMKWKIAWKRGECHGRIVRTWHIILIYFSLFLLVVFAWHLINRLRLSAIRFIIVHIFCVVIVFTWLLRDESTFYFYFYSFIGLKIMNFLEFVFWLCLRVRTNFWMTEHGHHLSFIRSYLFLLSSQIQCE